MERESGKGFDGEGGRGSFAPRTLSGSGPTPVLFLVRASSLMASGTPAMWCLLFLVLIIGGIETRHHAHRHERSRLRRQHQYDEPNIYVIEDEGGGTLESGDWGPWSEPSPCSRSCGGGVASQTRECSPYASSPCYGGKKRYFSCNTEECPGGENFRAEQCAEYNRVPFQGITYSWIPYKKAEEKCALNCMPVGERFYYRHKDQVVDGTPCSEEGRNICVNGKCLEVGCDNLLGSKMREDTCRVCGGDGSSCTTKSGVIEKNAQRIGYEDLFLIPSGATNINVRERRPSNNYLAVRNKTGFFYLNGNWKIDYSQSLRFAGTVFVYERKSFPFLASESLTALGPTNEAIYIAMLYQEPNPGIEYTYSVPKGSFQETPNEGYVWSYDSFSECNVTCGQGYQTRRVWCSQGRNEVDPDLCDSGSEPTSINICSRPACPAKWFTSDWSRCSAPCGEKGTRTRQVICQQEVGLGAVRVDESQCPEPVPRSSEECQEFGPCPTWHLGPWKPCDHLCGEGKQTRELHCYKKVNGIIELLSENACHEDRPESEKTCNLRPCEGLDWITSDWSGCSEKCGVTYETRTAQCANEKGIVFNSSMCEESLKPELVRNCTVTPCASQWFASQWSPCSAKCGTGIQSRDVFCVSLQDNTLNKVEDSKCDPKLKYENTKECKVEEECKGEWFSGPFGECSKPCGGGIQERKVLCIKNNKTVNLAECDESKIILRTEDCNKEPCGEDEIMPVETTQTIMEESSEECDSDYDYEDGSEEVSTDGILKFTDEIEDGSGFGADEFMTTLLGSSEKGSTSGETTSESTLLTSVGSSESIATDFLGDDAETASSGTATDSSTTAESGVSSDLTTSGETSASGASSASEAASASEAVSVSGASSASEAASASGASSASDASSSNLETTSEMATSDASTDSSSSLSSSTDSSTTDSPTSDSSSSDSSSSDSSSSASSDATLPEDISSTTEASESTPSIFDMISSSISSLMTDSESGTTPSSDLSTMTDSDVSGTSPGSTVSGESDSTGSDTTGGSEVTTSGETDGLTLVSGETASSEIEISQSTDSSSTDSSSESTTEMSGSTDWTLAIFNVTTQSPIDAAITKEQTMKKCKKKKGKSKCSKSKFGCCPDKTTEAKGPFGKGCSTPKTCKESKHGCCLDGVSAAKGPKYKGCPKPNCDQTLFGCCKDKTTPSRGNNYEGCPAEPTTIVDCMKSKFGCCPDGILSAMGPNFAGCVCDTCKPCNETEHGCCPDKVSAATGPNLEGCNIIKETDCAKSKHGCCPNGITAAEDPDKKGCESCKETEFGCCPDGVKSARGDNGFGCDPPCARGQFGCCHNNRTMAHGPNQEGCCLQYEFGCCPDLITPAEGPRNQGCECKNAAYGCCPDNRTPAKGYNNEGCGCQHTEHGCCPDNITPAEGPDFEGCSCHTFQFGCCPDGVTKLKGPYDNSCRCEATPNGCCSDGVTPKPNPNENCSCESTRYGCCPDGYTEAQGSKFEGCENVEPKGEVCSLPRDPGTCRDFRIVYYYDMRYGGCSRFWYGGCGGNLNRFNTLEECQQHCIFPPGKDACTLPMHAGLCHGNHPSWFYDNNSKRCQEFNHTGCLGNNNRFDTREHCENMCGTQEHLDPCLQSLEPGPCQGQYNRWYFNKETKTCSEFVYGGCKGTQNNFISEAACQYKCLKPAASLTEVCYEPLHRGNCSEEVPKWYYSTRDRKCMPFYYSGCDANQNNFDSREECERSCPMPRERDICTLPAVGGGCSNYTSRFYYDTAKKSCEHFYYGGCEGNENNFLTEFDCKRKCDKKPLPPSEPFTQEMCLLPPRDPGDCEDKIPRYSYNARTGYCESFAYSGCGGNRNNFESDDECEQSCGHLRERVPPPEPPSPPERPPPRPPGPPSKPRPYSRICYAAADPGPCLEQIPSWYFDSTTGTCSQFVYGGCEGNGNRFMSEEQCERQCGEYRLQDACAGYPVSGNTCAEPETKYYFNGDIQKCEPFEYNGCDGTANRFSTTEECESVCLQNIEPKVVKGKNSRGAFEICNQPLETGTCDKHITRWMYDDRERTCLSFLYTGCGGNLNNFETNEECIDYCATNDIDVGERPTKGCQSLEENCRGLQCNYGIERWVDENDCENCRCYNPCDVEPPPCGDRSLCHVERLYDEQTGTTQFRASCEDDEPQNHRGFCPQILPESPNCDNNCEYDSDCRIDEKCCYNGCGMTCTISVSEFVTQGPDTYIVPASISDDTPTYAEEEEGNLATFECNADGSPAPKVEWRRDSEIINSTTGGKYRVSNTGKLEIIGLERSDEGEYVCEADNGGGAPATRRYTLTVKAGNPRQVTVVNNPDEKELIATLNRPAVLRCYAIGYPSPTVSWWRGDKVLPTRGDGVEQRRDNSLYIQTVTPKHLGFYTCQLYNGVGSAASFTLTLKMYGPIDSYDPNDITYNPFLVPSPFRPPVDDRPRPPPYHPQDKVPVMVNISSTTQEFATGANVTMNCAQTAGNPPPEFRWLKDEEDIEQTDRIIVQDNRLQILNAQPEDSGDYTCVGYNRYSQARSSVKITIRSNILPPNCTDSPYFANCQLIVQANYCNHEYYAKFCCKSCTEAGKLGSPSEYRKKRSVVDFIRMRRSNYILPSRTDMHSPKKIRINNL